MGKPAAPQAPDPQETSAATTGTNVSSTIANNMMGMIGQSSPLGSLSYDQVDSYKWTDPYTGESYEVPMFEAVTELTNRGQKISDANTRTQLNLAQTAQDRSRFLENYMGKGIDESGLPAMSSLQGQLAGGLSDAFGEDFTGSRDDTEAALMSRMQPQIDRDRASLETRLANQGIGYGTDAWSAAMDDHNRGVNDARLAAISQAGNEQARYANMMMQAGAGQDAQRATALQQATALRNQPINEITALLSGSQLQSPNFGIYNPGGMPITDNAGIINDIYQGELNAYGTQANMHNSLMGGLFGLAGSIMSDIRLKTDFMEVGEQNGLPVYSFRYLWDEPGTERIGHIAQDVAQAYPEAVTEFGDYLAVDYGKLESAQ